MRGMRSAPRSVIGLVAVLASVAPACLTGPASPEAVAQDEDELRFRIGNVDTTLPDVDAIGYEVALRVDDRAGAETFEADVRGTYVATRPLGELALDLEGNTVDAVTVGTTTATYRREGDKLLVTLPRTFAAGSTITTRVRLHGAVRQADGTNPNDFTAYGGLMVRQRNAEGRRIFASLDWPSKARRWLPLRDHPRDGAMVMFGLTFPRAYTVVANGKRTAQVDNADGTRTWRYEALTPMPTYDFHVAAYEGWTTGEARATSGVPIATYAYARDASTVPAVYGDLPRVLDFYETTYGAFRWGSASFLEEPIFGGGMEHASVVSMDETLFRTPTEARRTAFHELGHHWSGNLVRIRTWNDFWLSEGVTDYLTAKAYGKLEGPSREKEVFRGYLATALATDARSPHALRPADPEVNVLSIFDGISYQKGACVMRLLEHVVGEADFTPFLRGWFDRHAFGAVTTADLERELSQAAGKDLGPLFRDVVYTAGHPVLTVSAAPAAGGAAGEVDVTVVQTQTGGPAEGYHLPLDVDLVDAAGRAKRFVVDLTGRTTVARVAAGFAPARVVADPDEVVVGTVSPR